MTSTALVRCKSNHPTAIRPDQTDSLVVCNLYMRLEAAAGSENTAEAKRRDLNGFLGFFTQAVGCDEPDHWTRSMTTGYLKYLEKQHRKSPTTINRTGNPSALCHLDSPPTAVSGRQPMRTGERPEHRRPTVERPQGHRGHTPEGRR